MNILSQEIQVPFSFVGVGKSLGRTLATTSLHKIYNHDYKKSFFQKLLENSNVPPEDKQKIRDLLKKPWNPSIRNALSTWNMIDKFISC